VSQPSGCWVETSQKPRRLRLKLKPLADARGSETQSPIPSRDREGVVPMTNSVSAARDASGWDRPLALLNPQKCLRHEGNC
jgi:hypothetical protein